VGILSREKRSFLLFLSIVILIGVGFFLPLSDRSLMGYVLKSIVFILVIVLIYSTSLGNLIGEADRNRDSDLVQRRGLVGDFSELEEQEDWTGFGNAFEKYYRTFLPVVRSAVVGSSIGLYFMKGKDQLEFQAGEDNSGYLMQKLRVEEGDLVEQVAVQNSPIIEPDLPDGYFLPGIPDTILHSFLGIPLNLKNRVVGVLAVGSSALEGFSYEDQEFVIRCGKLLTEVMAAYHQGMRCEIDMEVARMHIELEKKLSSVNDEEVAVSHFIYYLKRIFPYDRFSWCIREGEQGVIKYVDGKLDQLGKGTRFPLEEGLNGWVIKRNTPLVIADIEEGDYTRPRYFKDEYTRHGLHSFLGIPLGGEDSAWGVLSIESVSKNQYTEKEKDVFSSIAIPFKIAIERIRKEK